ncbi:reverse transcriptase domain-containing protein [Tanacetum coccineum]
MSTHSGPSPTTNTSAVRNTVGRGKEKSQENPNEPASDAALREFCDKNYNQLLPILAEKMHQEKVQQEKLKAVKARLNFEETSQYSESGAPSRRRDVRKRLGPKDARSMSRSPEPRRDRSRSPRRKDPKRETVFRRLEKGVFHRLGDKEKGMSAYSGSSRRQSHHSSRGDTESYYQSSRSRGMEPAPKRHHDRKAYSRKGGRMSENEDSAGGHWKSKSKKQRSSMEDEDNHGYVKTYDGSEDPEDHLKILQAAAKVEQWAMPTWCHMFNSTLTGNARVWFDDLLPESIYSYDDLKEAFLAKYLQQKKCIKDPVEIHNIKQREGESTEDFVRRFKIESRDVKGAPEVMRILGFMHGITNPELIKRLHDKIPKSVDEMWKITTAFLRGEAVAGNHERKKTFRKAVAFDQRVEAKQWERPRKGGKKGEAAGKDKPLAILMVQAGHKIDKQRITQTFSPETMISFPPLGEEDGTEGPMVIEAEEIRNQMVPATIYLVGFSGEIIWPLGQVSLLVKTGDEEHSTFAWMNVMVVRSHSPYNGIIGRPGVRRIKAIPSTDHGMLKFPVTGKTVTLRSSRIIPLECAMISGPKTQQPVVDQLTEEKIQVAIHPEYPEQTIAIGSTLTEEGRKKLCGLLRQNLYIFAWKPADMTEVSCHIAEHRLNVRERCFPVRQTKRGQAPERNKAICEEVEKLVNAGIMKEVYYHSWLSNPVMVKKHDNSWRMCVDFKDLNKACPKDGYPLPK